MDHYVGLSRRQALLAAAATATALIDMASLPLALSMAPVLMGFHGIKLMGRCYLTWMNASDRP